MRTANPVLRDPLLLQVAPAGQPAMTLHGVLGKAMALACLVAVAFFIPWQRLLYQPLSAEALAACGMGIGMIFSAIAWMRRDWAGLVAPVVALCVGLLLGGMSAYLHREVGGLVGIALVGSPAAFGVLLWLHHAHLAEPGERVRACLNVVTGALFLLYLVTFALQPIELLRMPLLLTEPVGAMFCVLVVSVAALNLVLDFDRVGEVVRAGASEELEWYAAFGLLISLVWMYPESIRLVTRLHSRVRRSGMKPA